MDKNSLIKLLESVATGKTTVENAAAHIHKLPFEDIDYAHIDHHRSLRKGFPEVIFGQGKSAEQIGGILARMMLQENIILVTRVDSEKAEKVLDRYPELEYHTDARIIIHKKNEPVAGGRVLISAVVFTVCSLTKNGSMRLPYWWWWPVWKERFQVSWRVWSADPS